DDFRGAEPGAARRVRTAAGFAEVERLEGDAGPPVPLNRDAFVARLLGFRRPFAAPPKVKLALMTLSPKVRGELDGPWEGMAQLRLHGEHAPGAPAEAVLVIRYELARPTAEGLGRPGWLHGAALTQVLTARAPRYLFAEVAAQSGLEPRRWHDNWKGPG